MRSFTHTGRSCFMPRMAVGWPSKLRLSATLIIVMTKFTVRPTRFWTDLSGRPVTDMSIRLRDSNEILLEDLIMKTIPILATLLICQSMFLEFARSRLDIWHSNLFRVAGFDPQLIEAHSHWLQLLTISRTGLVLLCLVLVIVVWKYRLCRAWLAAGITLLWIVLFYQSFLTPIVN
jgi:hypothetical protein